MAWQAHIGIPGLLTVVTSKMNWRFLFRKLQVTLPALQYAMLSAVLFSVVGTDVHAQLVAPTGASSAPEEDPMERAKRQANNVMRWIKVHADKPRTSPAKPNEPAPAPAVRPATKAAATPPRPAPAAETASGTTAPASEPVQQAVAAEPTPQTPPPVIAPAAPPPPVAATPAIAKTPPPPPVDEEDETPLRVLSQSQPVIPRNVLAALNTGKVMVKFVVETNGNVSNVEILSSSSPVLNKPTIAAVSVWRFEPIKIPRPAQIEIDFNP